MAVTYPLFRRTLAGGIEAWGLKIDEAALERFERHYTAVVEANRRFNLTAVTGEAGAAALHFLDALALLRYREPGPGESLIDVGAGAGFPGMVLKAARPALTVTLLESNRKKAEFLRQVIAALGLERADAVWGRAEDEARRPGRRESFDWAVARGVAAMRVLCEYCLPFVRTGGFFVAYKGPGVEPELQEARSALSVLGGEVTAVERFSLLPAGEERRLVFVKKVRRTPAEYPRRAGLPVRRPL